MKFLIFVVLLIAVLELDNLICNNKVLIAVVYNISSNTSSIVNTRFRNLGGCKSAYDNLIKENEFPRQQYFIIKGGCY